MKAGTLTLFLALWVTFIPTFAERKSYEGYQEWEVFTGHNSQLELLDELETTGQIEILQRRVHGRGGVILVSPSLRVTTYKNLLVSGIRTRVLTANVQENIDKQYESTDARAKTFSFDINKYNTFDDLIAQLDVWVAKCPADIECSKYSIGKSYEGREQMMLKFKKAGTTNKALYFEFTIHAREWLSTTTGQNLINKIVNEYTSDADTKHLVDNYDIYILLVANPDGYVYTFTNDRLWRKSRGFNGDGQCRGTDLNRNFDIKWGKQGTSKISCMPTYQGRSPASEPEVKNMQKVMDDLAGNAIATYAVHCCAKMWMFPYGNTENFKAWNPCNKTMDHDDLTQAAVAGVDAVEKESGVRWKAGTICSTIYPVTGSTSDYSYSKANIKYSWAIEVAGWFISPEENIQPVFKQFWLALVASTREIENIEGKSS